MTRTSGDSGRLRQSTERGRARSSLRYQALTRLKKLLERFLTAVQLGLVSTGSESTIAQSERDPSSSLALLAGWFSVRGGGATFGDTESLRVAALWLDRAGIPYDIAAHPSSGVVGLDIAKIDAERYTHFVFVCGPWSPRFLDSLFHRFKHCRTVGVGLSIEGDGHGFDALLPRDFGTAFNPDLAFGSEVPSLPVAGVVLAHRQRQYHERQRGQRVTKILEAYLRQEEVVPIYLDTSQWRNRSGIETATQFQNLIRKMDVVISTRLHGMVFALKSGIPVVAIDAVAGGAKVTAQANVLGWPVVLNGDDVTEESLAEAVRFCLSGAFAETLLEVQARARERLAAMEPELIEMLKVDSASRA